MAMQSFLEAEELEKDYTDTLTYSNMLATQAILFYRSFQLEPHISYNLRAAELYERIGKMRHMQLCLLKALEGSIVIGDKERADSIICFTQVLSSNANENRRWIESVRLLYGLEFNSLGMIRQMLDSISDLTDFDNDSKINFTLGFIKLGDMQRA